MKVLWTTALAIAACSTSLATQGPPAPPPMPVQIATVRAAPLRDTSEYVAVLQPQQSVRLQPQAEGYITRILVSPGDKCHGEPR